MAPSPLRPGLVFKLSLLTATLVISTVVVICTTFIINEKDALLEHTRTESLSLARTVAAALAYAVVVKEYAFIIEHSMQVVKIRDDLRYIIVVSNGDSLIHLADSWRSEQLHDPVSVRMAKIDEQVFHRHHSALAKEEVLEAAVPIRISKAKWGVLRLGFSARPLEKRVDARFREAVMIGLACLVFGLAGVLLLTRLITGPILQLTRAARSISGGDLEQRVKVASSDEIGELAATFNKMSQDLQRTVAAEKAKTVQLARAFEEIDQAHQELKETQAKLIQSDRLATVGELAAGVAHEINNPLSAVLTYAILLDEQIDGLAVPLREQLGSFPNKLDKIKIGAQRCKTIADNLLAFSRQSHSEHKAHTPLAEVISNTLDLIGVWFSRAGVEVIVDVPSKLTVWGSANQLQQLVTNLANNAIQAMKGQDDARLWLEAAANGDEQVTLTISDSGPGIAEEHRDRIFDPFYTTKPTGQGTGLGLSIVYGIVKGHRGEISVESVAGKGATFRITLPENPAVMA